MKRIKEYKFFIICMCVIALLDYISTWVALNMGFTEKNFIFSLFMDLPYFIIVLINLIVVLAIIFAVLYFKLSKISQYIIIGFYFLCVLSNYVVIILANLGVIKPY